MKPAYEWVGRYTHEHMFRWRAGVQLLPSVTFYFLRWGYTGHWADGHWERVHMHLVRKNFYRKSHKDDVLSKLILQQIKSLLAFWVPDVWYQPFCAGSQPFSCLILVIMTWIEGPISVPCGLNISRPTWPWFRTGQSIISGKLWCRELEEARHITCSENRDKCWYSVSFLPLL